MVGFGYLSLPEGMFEEDDEEIENYVGRTCGECQYSVDGRCKDDSGCSDYNWLEEYRGEN